MEWGWNAVINTEGIYAAYQVWFPSISYKL